MADGSNYNMDWSAAISAGAQLLGTGAQIAYQGEADKYNRKLFRETRDLQRQWALEDYEKVLRDSSPSEQVRRLKEAGLNPNLVYGSGNIQTGVTSAPKVDMPSLPYKQRGLDLDLSAANAIGTYLDIALKKAQINKVEADTSNVQSKTEGQELLNTMQSMQNETYEYTQQALKEQPYLENQLTTANIQNVTSSTSLLKAKLNLTEEQTKLVSEQLLEVQAKVKLLASQTRLTEQQIITEVFKAENLKADSQLKVAMASVQPSLASMYQSIAALNAENTSFLQDTHNIRYGQEVNKVSKLAEEVQNISESTKLVQAEQVQKAVDTGNRVLNGFLQVGDLVIDVLDYRSRRASSVRGRHSKTTVYGSSGKVQRTVTTDSY